MKKKSTKSRKASRIILFIWITLLDLIKFAKIKKKNLSNLPTCFKKITKKGKKASSVFKLFADNSYSKCIIIYYLGEFIITTLVSHHFRDLCLYGLYRWRRLSRICTYSKTTVWTQIAFNWRGRSPFCCDESLNSQRPPSHPTPPPTPR